MSKIYEQLRQAEAERERIVAERKRLEAEADAALAARERDDRLRKAGAAPAPPPLAPDAEAERKLAEVRARAEAGRRAAERAETERAAVEEETRPVVAASEGGVSSTIWILSAAAVLAAGIVLGMFIPRQPPPSPRDPGFAAAVLPVVPEGSLALKLDRDLEAFAEGVAQKDRR